MIGSYLAIEDDATTTQTLTSGTQLAWSHTTAGSSVNLILQVAWRAASAQTISSITVDGVAPTLLRSQVNGTLGHSVYYVINAGVGSKAIIVNFSGTVGAAGGAVSFKNADDLFPLMPTGNLSGLSGTSNTVPPIPSKIDSAERQFYFCALNEAASSATISVSPGGAGATTYWTSVEGGSAGDSTLVKIALISQTNSQRFNFSASKAYSIIYGQFMLPAAQTGWVAPTTAENIVVSGGYPNWSNMTAAFATDANYATTTANGSGLANTLRLSGFQFNLSDAAVLRGFQAKCVGYGGGSDVYTVFYARKGSTTYHPTGHTFNNCGSGSVVTELNSNYALQGVSSYQWGTTWTPSEFNSVAFDGEVAPGEFGGSSDQNIDSLLVRAWYTTPLSTEPLKSFTAVDRSQAIKTVKRIFVL